MYRLLSLPWMLPTAMCLRDRVTTTYRVSSIWLQKWCNLPDKAMKACDTMTLIYRLLSEPSSKRCAGTPLPWTYGPGEDVA